MTTSPPSSTSRTHRRTHRMAVWAALLVTVLWSSSWVLIRFGLDDESLPPITFAGLRYGLAALLLVGWTAGSVGRRAAVRKLGPRDVTMLAILGVGFYAVTQGAQFIAIDNQPAATTSLVLSLTPLLVAFFGVRSLGEQATRRQFVGAALVVAGAWLYFVGDLGATTVGMIAAVAGLLANSSSSLLGRRVNRDLDAPAVVVTSISMAVGAGLLVVAGLLVEGVPELSGRAAAIIVWLAVVNTAGAFTMWNFSLRHLTAIESAGINNTMLIQIALLAWIFLDEPPGRAGIVGIVVVSTGVFLTQASRAGSTAQLRRRRRSHDSL